MSRQAAIIVVLYAISGHMKTSVDAVNCNCQDNQVQVQPCTESSDVVCRNCTVCQENQYMQQWCTSTQDTICGNCSRCELGVQYASYYCGPHGYHDTVCANCTLCADSQYEVAACSAYHDTLCADCNAQVCPSGQYLSGLCGPANASTCKPCSTCSEGQFMVQYCNLTHDTICQNCTVCGSGEYASRFCGPNGYDDTICTRCSACTSDEYVAFNCSNYQDTVCASCDIFVCPGGTYRDGPCVDPDGQPNYKCAQCSSCSANQFMVSPCNATADTVCQACSSCEANRIPVSGCNATHDIVCKDCAVCLEGQYMQQYCNLTHDTICKNCTPCEKGIQYSNYFCGPNGYLDNQCQNCSVCGHNQYELMSCNPNSNAICKDCTLSDCPSGFHKTGTCGPEGNSDYQCMPCTVCNSNQAVLQNCTSTTDTVCKDCTICKADLGASWGQYRAGTCGPNSDYTCHPCSRCAWNQYEIVECKDGHDHTCFNCTETCPNGTYRVGVCGPETWFDYQCINCTACGVNETEVVPCGGVTDAICVPASGLGPSTRRVLLSADAFTGAGPRGVRSADAPKKPRQPAASRSHVSEDRAGLVTASLVCAVACIGVYCALALKRAAGKEKQPLVSAFGADGGGAAGMIVTGAH